MGICDTCTKGLSAKSKALKCKACSRQYHTYCAPVSDDLYKLVKSGHADWKCSKCPSKLNDSIISVDTNEGELTEVEINFSELGNETTQLNKISSYDFSKCTADNIPEYLKSLFDTVVMEIHKSQKFICTQIDHVINLYKNVQNENKILKNKVEQMENSSSIMEKKVNHLEALLDKSHHLNNEKNIVLAGLPKQTKIDKNLILAIASKINANITSTDINKVSAINKHSKEDNISNPIYLLELNTLAAKTEMMSKKRTYKQLFTAELNLTESDNRQIFFRHHLSPLQAKLYAAAKKIKTQHEMEFLWVKDECIFLRQTKESKVFKIINFNDINFVINHFNSTN